MYAQCRSGNTYWHQDTVIPMEEGKEGDYLMLKLQLYFDDIASGKGSLWVLPGSHRKDYHHAVRELIEQCDKENDEALTPEDDRVPNTAGASDLMDRGGFTP